MSGTLTIRNLDAAVKQKLRLRAALHQRSMEAEAREILAQAVAEGAPAGGPEGLSPQERMRAAVESVRGIWKERLTTDEVLEMTRGEASDDAHPR
jgi:hypothetical protein